MAKRIPILQLIEDIGTIDELTVKVAMTLIETIELAVSLARIGLQAVSGWTLKVKEVQMKAQRLQRRYQELCTDEAWKAYRQARNKKSRLIKKALQLAYRERI